MIKAMMAQLIRPATERRTPRHNKSPSSPPPPASDDVASPQQPGTHAPTISTRRAARAALPRDETTPNATLPAASEKPSSSPALSGPASRSSRKRRASELAPDARPPTKIKVAQPHGQLLGITNGVPHELPMGTDDIPSGASTPKTAGKGASLAVPAHTPAPAPASNDKRSLRSHDGGSRLKSDLATYFGNYDDIMAGVPKSPELLDVDTPIYLVDEPLKSPKPQNPPIHESPRKSVSPTRSRKPQPPTPTRKSSVASIPPARSCTNFPVLDYTSIAKHIRPDDDADPLADSVYFAQHRRAERKEKQLRNIEKDRAMHEKAQLERLLDGLQGPDWLKVMGITGVTDGERKTWEPKRDYFVKEVQALVDKFRLWKEQEKKQRAEKEAANAAKEDEEDESSVTPEPRKPAAKRPSNNHDSHSHNNSTARPSPPKPRRPPRPHGFYLPVVPAHPTVPFTSFFAKPHLRQAALGKQRHGRGALAFGHPVPEVEEREFELPGDYVTEDFLRDNARERRRRRRRTREGG